MAVVRNRGYVQLRRGLFEHVQSGEMFAQIRYTAACTA
jgi:hypothetical protein